MTTELSDIIASVYVNGTITALARIVDWGNNLLLQETTGSIVYTLTDPNGDAVSGHTNVALDKTVVLFDTLQTSPAGIWTVDSTGFNFMHTVDVATLGAAFASAGQYELVYTIAPTNGQNIIIRYAITAF
jgi:hypothetical protein